MRDTRNVATVKLSLMKLFVMQLLVFLLFLAMLSVVSAQNYPSTWQVNGNGYTGLLVLQTYDALTDKVTGTLLGTPVEGYLVGRHLVLHRYPQGKTQIWESWIMDPALGAQGQAYYDGSYFMAGYVSENAANIDGVYPWYGLAVSQNGQIPSVGTTQPPNTNTNQPPNSNNSNTTLPPGNNTSTNQPSNSNNNSSNQPPTVIPSGSTLIYNGNNHSYKIYESSATWKEAKVYCENQGAYLATLTSQAENDFVYNNLIAPIGHYVWLGGSDEASEGNWQWVTGEAWNYSNWPSNQPDNYQGNEHFLQSFYINSNLWNDLANDHRYPGYDKMYFVCEWGYPTISTNQPSNVNAPSDAKTYLNNNHKYKIYETSMTWKQAVPFCEAQGGYLATLTSQTENDFVYNNVIGSINAYIWLGGTDESAEGNWQWITGEPWTFSIWAANEPNNSGGTEHYLESNYYYLNQWNDASDISSYSGIPFYPLCEWGGFFTTVPISSGWTEVGANLVKNGDFEELPINTTHLHLANGVAFLNYWEVEAADPNLGVDVTRMSDRGYSFSGEQGIDMAGTPGPGSIYQNLYLEAGKTYRLGFAASSNGDEKINGLSIYWGNLLVDTITTPKLGTWQEFSFDLYAETDKVQLKFVGNIEGDQGSLLDAVSLYELSGSLQGPSPTPTTTNPPSSKVLSPENISSWKDLGGNAIDLAVQGTTVWMLAKDNSIYYYDDGWHPQPGNWSAKAINVSRDGVLWVIGTDNKIYNNKNGVWTEQAGGGRASDIALDESGNPSVIGGYGGGGGIHFWQDDKDDYWPQYSGAGRGTQVAVSSDGIPYTIGTDGKTYRHTDTGWINMGIENVVDITIGGNNQLWAVNKDSEIYYYDVGEWHLHSIGKGKRISASANNQVCVVGLDDHIWCASYK